MSQGASDVSNTVTNVITVLDEADFTEKIRYLIRRDFFPDTDEMRLQNQTLESMNDSNDEGNRVLSQQLDSRLSATETKCGRHAIRQRHDLTTHSNISDEAEAELAEITLDQFLSKNTSCDNIAFDRVIEKLRRADKAKMQYSWLYQNDAEAALEANKSCTFDELGQVISERHLTRPLDTWSYNAKNSLMYYPDGNSSTACNKREIVHSNTRLSAEASKSLNIVAKPAGHHHKIANQGLSITVSSDGLNASVTNRIKSYSNVSNLNSPSSWLAARYTKKQKSFDRLIPSTPTIEPDRDLDSPFMTWGQVEGTPTMVSGNNTPLFRIPDTPERDVLARKLAEDASVGSRNKKRAMLRHLINESIRTPQTIRSNLSTPTKLSHPLTPRQLSLTPTIHHGKHDSISSKRKLNHIACISPNIHSSSKDVASTVNKRQCMSATSFLTESRRCKQQVSRGADGNISKFVTFKKDETKQI